MQGKASKNPKEYLIAKNDLLSKIKKAKAESSCSMMRLKVQKQI